MIPQRLPTQIPGTAYTLQAADLNDIFYTSNSGAVTITVPPNLLDIGASITICQQGTGQVSVAAGAGVTINPAATLKITSQYGVAGLYQISLNVWTFFGNISA